MSRPALPSEAPPLTALAIRLAVPADRAAVIAMHHDCSADSIRRRWHGPRHDLPEPYLTEALAGLPRHIALLALDGPRVVALASAVQQDREAWEIGVLVIDTWQRRGVATTLINALAQQVAARRGRRLTATALPEQAATLAHLERLGPVTLTTNADPVTARLDLAVASPPPCSPIRSATAHTHRTPSR